MGFISNKLVQESPSAAGGVFSGAAAQSAPTKTPGYFQRLANKYVQAKENIIGNVKEGVQGVKEGFQQGGLAGAQNVKTSAERAVVRSMGEVAGAVTAPIEEAPIVKPLLELAGRGISKIPGVEELTQKANELALRHPESAKDFEAIVNLASLIPVTKGAKLAATGAEKGLTSTGKALKGAGESAYGIGVGMEEGTKIALQSYEATKPTLMGRVKNLFTGEKPTVGNKPITEANTAIRRGLMGTEWQLGVQAKRIADDIWTKGVKPALESNKEKINMRSFISELADDIIKKTPELGRRKALLEALDSFGDDFKKVNNFSVKKLQEYKEGWAKHIPEATYKGKPIGSALKDVKNLAAQKARGIIYDKLGPEVKQAYLDYGNLQSIEKAGIKSVDLLRSKGVTRQVWEAVIDKVLTPVATIGGQVLYKTGEGLEFLGGPGAKKVKDLIGVTKRSPSK